MKIKVPAVTNAEPRIDLNQRKRRLQRRQEQERAHRQSESAEQRKERPRRRILSDRARHVAQTVEQRQLCLQQRHNQLNVESAQEREARLHDLNSHQHERLATESNEKRERETKLRDFGARQHERLSIESPEQTAARLCQMNI